MSKEHARASLIPYSKNIEAVQNKLYIWHDNNVKRFKINLLDMNRKREGVDAFLHGLPGLFNDSHNYQSLHADFVELISFQKEGVDVTEFADNSELYDTDVQLYIDDGHVYYLPEYNE